MTTPLEILQWERRRKLQVREALRAGIAAWEGLPGDPVPFYAACADYLIPAQRRLIDQDLRLASLIGSRISPSQAGDREKIDSLLARLHESDRQLQAFEAAAADLGAQGTAARSRFELAARAYMDFLVNVLGARSHSLRHLTSTLLTESDWEFITGATPGFLAEEGRLFERVQLAAPSGVDPAAISTDRPARPAPG